MFRPLIYSLILAVLLPLAGFAQQNEFRAVSSGVWSDTRNWEQENSGVWLRPAVGVYPGNKNHQAVNVTIDQGATVVIKEGQEVHINSLTVMNGRLEVNGVLVVGEFKDENDGEAPSEQTNDVPLPTILASSIQLLQNAPNPVITSTGGITTFTFYIDTDYPSAHLSIYDELGREVQRIYDQAHPETGWHSLKIGVTDLRSGSYHIVFQAGNAVRHCIMMVVQ